MLTICSFLVRMVSPAVAVLVVVYGGLEGRGLALMACQKAAPHLTGETSESSPNAESVSSESWSCRISLWMRQ
jgi:hypothetical protein